MAVAKKAAPKKARSGTSIIKWEDQMREAATKQAAHEKVQGSFQSIGTRGGILTVDEAPVPGNEIRGVVLMAVKENAFYEDAFNPSVMSIPVCFAFAGEDEEEDDMKPHADSSNPQNADCKSCPLNEMGSADTGRGKACKNLRRLAIVTEDAIESVEQFEEAAVRILKVPPTSIKFWSKHVNRLKEEMERPSWCVTTVISAAQDAKTQFKILFAFENLINFTQPLWDAVTRRRAELAKEMVLPYNPVTEAPAPAKRGAKAKAKMAPPKRSVAAKPAAKKAVRKF